MDPTVLASQRAHDGAKMALSDQHEQRIAGQARFIGMTEARGERDERSDERRWPASVPHKCVVDVLFRMTAAGDSLGWVS